MIRVITVEREYGSGGLEIASRLAASLGWELVDSILVQKVAEQCQINSSLAQSYDERRDPWYHRLSKAFWRGSPEVVLESTEAQTFDSDRMVAHVRKLIEAAADKGNCVILGRGAACILSSRMDAFHCFIYGCRTEKLEYARKHVSPETTPEKLERVDRERAAYIREYFGLEWDNRKLYDLMINSAVGHEAVVDAVLSAASLKKSVRELRSA